MRAWGGNQFIFVTDDEEAIFTAAYDAMREAGSDLALTPIPGATLGYKMKFRWGADHHTTTIKVFRAEGVTAAGHRVIGYYPEVSGTGTMSGLIIRLPTKSAYKFALANFGMIGSRQQVSDVRRVRYKSDEAGHKPAPPAGFDSLTYEQWMLRRHQ